VSIVRPHAKSVVDDHVHVIGAGLAGLSAAVRLVKAGVKVSIYEAGSEAGGRCRSFFDSRLGCRIDNGNHLILSSNHAVMDYLQIIEAENTLHVHEEAVIPFVDLEEDIRWKILLKKRLGLWALLFPSQRVPGTRLIDYVTALRLVWAADDKAIGQCLKTSGSLWRRFWSPLCVSVLNTDPALASAKLLRAVVWETFISGPAVTKPLVPKDGLSETFVNPALTFLKEHNADFKFNFSVRKLDYSNGRVARLLGRDSAVDVARRDMVVLALPPFATQKLLPELGVPDKYEPIINGHFRLRELEHERSFIGIVGGTAEWLFWRDNIVSTTVSSAKALLNKTNEELAMRLWCDISRVFSLRQAELPPYRIIREKRATFTQTPEQVQKRPKMATAFANLWLAGDWIDTGLPATIEGSVRSGEHAARAVIKNIKIYQGP